MFLSLKARLEQTINKVHARTGEGPASMNIHGQLQESIENTGQVMAYGHYQVERAFKTRV